MINDWRKIFPVLNNRLMVAACHRYDDIGAGKRGILKENGDVLLELPVQVVSIEKQGHQEWFDNLNNPNYMEIIDVGLDCEMFSKEMGRRWREEHDAPNAFGETVLCPRLWNDMAAERIEGIEYTFPPEEIVAPILVQSQGIKPVGDWVAIESNLADESEQGGIFIRPDHQRLATTGVVLAVGPDVNIVETGDIVMMPKHVMRFGYMGKEISCLEQDDLLCVYE